MRFLDLDEHARLSMPKRVKAVVLSEHGQAAVLRIQFDADFVQLVVVLAEQFGDTSDGEVSYRSYRQATRLACALDPRQFHGSNSSSL
jgi:hypothetical protein